MIFAVGSRQPDSFFRSRSQRSKQTLVGPHRRALVLLEVVLALSMTVTAAGVVVGSLSTSMRAVRRLRLETQAADLAVTVASLVRLGLIDTDDPGPQQFEAPLADWTWQIVTSPVSSNLEEIRLRAYEIIVTHTGQGHSYRLVVWLTDQSALAAGGMS